MKKAKEDYELLLARQKETVDKELQQAQKREVSDISVQEYLRFNPACSRNNLSIS